MADDTYSMLVDGKAVQVDLGPVLRRWRARHIAARVNVVDEAAGLLMDPAFDPVETWDAAVASGVPDSALDAAGHVAVTLHEIEITGSGPG
jgi:hypothetical protein